MRAISTTTTEATGFSWLLDTFVRTAPGVRYALVVSADGLLMAMSGGLDRTTGDQLAAIVAGISSLTRGAARHLGTGDVRQAVVEMDGAHLFAMAVGEGSVLAALTEPDCDVGVVGFEMATLVQRCQQALTPQLVATLRAALPLSGARRPGGR
ncbi:MAG: roadblock/LC7 domain-containing protein [Kineosporiaceae bacterium]